MDGGAPLISAHVIAVRLPEASSCCLMLILVTLAAIGSIFLSMSSNVAMLG